MATRKIEGTDDAWESRALGASEDHVAVAGEEHEIALDEALGLKCISIRLPKEMIEQYKLIGHFHGVGYQPLMRDVLSRFVPGALREILEEQSKKAEKAIKGRAPLHRKAEQAPLRKAA